MARRVDVGLLFAKIISGKPLSDPERVLAGMMGSAILMLIFLAYSSYLRNKNFKSKMKSISYKRWALLKHGVGYLYHGHRSALTKSSKLTPWLRAASSIYLEKQANAMDVALKVYSGLDNRMLVVPAQDMLLLMSWAKLKDDKVRPRLPVVVALFGLNAQNRSIFKSLQLLNFLIDDLDEESKDGRMHASLALAVLCRDPVVSSKVCRAKIGDTLAKNLSRLDTNGRVGTLLLMAAMAKSDNASTSLGTITAIRTLVAMCRGEKDLRISMLACEVIARLSVFEDCRDIILSSTEAIFNLVEVCITPYIPAQAAAFRALRGLCTGRQHLLSQIPECVQRAVRHRPGWTGLLRSRLAVQKIPLLTKLVEFQASSTPTTSSQKLLAVIRQVLDEAKASDGLDIGSVEKQEMRSDRLSAGKNTDQNKKTVGGVRFSNDPNPPTDESDAAIPQDSDPDVQPQDSTEQSNELSTPRMVDVSNERGSLFAESRHRANNTGRHSSQGVVDWINAQIQHYDDPQNSAVAGKECAQVVMIELVNLVGEVCSYQVPVFLRCLRQKYNLLESTDPRTSRLLGSAVVVCRPIEASLQILNSCRREILTQTKVRFEDLDISVSGDWKANGTLVHAMDVSSFTGAEDGTANVSTNQPLDDQHVEGGWTQLVPRKTMPLNAFLDDFFDKYPPSTLTRELQSVGAQPSLSINKQFARDVPTMLRVNGQRPQGSTDEDMVRFVWNVVIKACDQSHSKAKKVCAVANQNLGIWCYEQVLSQYQAGEYLVMQSGNHFVDIRTSKRGSVVVLLSAIFKVCKADNLDSTTQVKGTVRVDFLRKLVSIQLLRPSSADHLNDSKQ